MTYRIIIPPTAGRGRLSDITSHFSRFLSLLALVLAMRPKASKRSLSTAPASAGNSDEDDRSKKRVRWDPKSDEMGQITASDDFEGMGEECNAISEDEKVRLFLYRRIVSYSIPGLAPRFVLRSALKGEGTICV